MAGYAFLPKHSAYTPEKIELSLFSNVLKISNKEVTSETRGRGYANAVTPVKPVRISTKDGEPGPSTSRQQLVHNQFPTQTSARPLTYHTYLIRHCIA